MKETKFLVYAAANMVAIYLSIILHFICFENHKGSVALLLGLLCTVFSFGLTNVLAYFLMLFCFSKTDD